MRPHRELRRNGEGVGARNLAHRSHYWSDICGSIEWQWLRVFAVSAGPGVLGIFLLQMSGIGEQDVGQLDRRRIRIDRAMKSVAQQRLQITRVVQMRVRQYAPIEGLRLLRKR